MNRWIVETNDTSLRFPTFKWYAPTIEEVQKQFPEAKITQDFDRSYLKYIELIKEKSTYPLRYDPKGREMYAFRISGATLIVKFSKDEDGYLDIAFYQTWEDKRYLDPVGFILSDPKYVYDKFMGEPMTYERISYRQYGQPKLSKPKELKGIKQNFSGEYIAKKCNCPCFCVGDDLYIQHKDFFSSAFESPDEDFGKPVAYLAKKYFDHKKSEKFIYPDGWGSIILRDEAWIVFKNIRPVAERNNSNQLARIMVDMMIDNDIIAKRNLSGYSEFILQWERFYEDVAKKYQKVNKSTQIEVHK